jgi:very-short-patch-repair endonuclease
MEIHAEKLRRAGELRKETTPAEKKLWAHLRLMREGGIRFHRLARDYERLPEP